MNDDEKTATASAATVGGTRLDGAAASVSLTPLRPSDSAALLEWINDRELVLLNAPFRPVTAAEHAEWFDAVQRRADTVIVGIRLAPREELIGTAQLHSIHAANRSAELQIRIADPARRGKGYGTAALRLLLDLAFRDLNLHRVQLHVFATNARAIRTYEKVGFVQEGLLRQAAWIDGSYVDVVAMAILREEHRVKS